MQLGPTCYYYTPAPGFIPEGEAVYCGVCADRMNEVRNCTGPKSYTEAMSKHVSKYDEFSCHNKNEQWHRQIVALRFEIEKTASSVLTELMLGEIIRIAKFRQATKLMPKSYEDIKKEQEKKVKVIYSDMPIDTSGKSIFLAGPTPRSADVKSWRIEALSILEEIKFKHTVLVPELSGWTPKFSYENQVEWEHQGLEKSTRIVFWVPRDLQTMPAFTTNVEFGRYVASGRALYGRPDGAPNTRYLDWLYTKYNNCIPHADLRHLLTTAKELLE